jgi:hypothetical protein
MRGEIFRFPRDLLPSLASTLTDHVVANLDDVRAKRFTGRGNFNRSSIPEHLHSIKIEGSRGEGLRIVGSFDFWRFPSRSQQARMPFLRYPLPPAPIIHPTLYKRMQLKLQLFSAAERISHRVEGHFKRRWKSAIRVSDFL